MKSMTSGRDSNGRGSSKLIKECFKSHLRWSEWHFRVGVTTKLIKMSFSPELCWKLQHCRISEVSKLVETLIIHRKRRNASAIGSTRFNRHYSLKPEEIQPDPACYASQWIFQMHFFSLVVNYNTRKFGFMCN